MCFLRASCLFQNKLYLKYTACRHNLSFCKTILQIILSAKRFASILSFWRFTEDIADEANSVHNRFSK